MRWWKHAEPKRIYMDAAAATPLRQEVRARMEEAEACFGNPGALHKEGLAASLLLEAARAEAAQAIGAHADELVFTGSGTEANNLAIFGAAGAPAGAHIITSAVEHPSVLEPIRALERHGARATYLSVDESGRVDLKALKESLAADTALVSIGMVNSEVGTIQDIRDIAKVIRDAKKEGRTNARFHVDAAQAPLWLSLNVEQLHPDLLTLDAQKMLGPKGVGMLYVLRGTALAPQILGGGQERGLRSGTPPVALVAGLARALSLAASECAENAQRIAEVRDALWSALQRHIPGAMLNGALEGRVANNLNVSVPGLIGERAVLALSQWGVDASTRSACAAKDEELSHVIRALYPGAGGAARARTAVRFSLLPSARLSDAQRAAELLGEAARMYCDIDA